MWDIHHQTHADSVTTLGVKEDKEEEEEGGERRGESLEAAWAGSEEQVPASEAGCRGHLEQDIPAEPLKDSFVECPICGEAFPSYVVEVHASMCGDSGTDSSADCSGRRLAESGCIVID